MRRSYAEMVQLTKYLLNSRVLWITRILWSSPLSLLNMLSCSATGTAPMIHACSTFIFAAHSVYRTPQITALVDSRCSNPQQNCEGLWGEPCQLPWGANDVSDLPLLTPVAVLQWEKIYLSLLLLAPPTSGTEDESYLSILIPGAGRPCLFILIGSICGTAVAGGGWCWQRFVHAFPWQQYSWQAREQTVRTQLINTNNEAANQEWCWSRQIWGSEYSF